MAFNPIQTSSLPFWNKVKLRIWSLVNATLYRYSFWFMRGWRRFLLRMFGANIASTASPARTAKISCPWNLAMKDYSSIGENSWIYTLDKILIGEKTCIGDEVQLLTGSHDVASPDFSLMTKPIVIDNCCWIATRSMVMPGCHIGEGSVVAAGSIVTKDIPSWTVVGGNPAKFIKKRVINE